MSTSGAAARVNPQALIEELRILLAKNVQGNMKLLNRLSSLVKEASKEISASSDNRRLPQGDQLIARLLDLNFAYYSLLSDHGLAFLNEFFNAAERTLGLERADEGQTSTTTETSRAGIDLSARIGESAVAPFVIENHHTSALRVSFQAGDFLSLKGDRVSAEQIAFDPPTLSLEPTEQSIVRAMVTVTDAFKVGETYVTNINLVGFQAKDITLTLTIQPPLNSKRRTARTVIKKKPRKKAARKTKRG